MIMYTTPWSVNSTPPADASWGTPWGTPAPQTTPYVDKGFTREGLRFRMAVQRQNVQVDQVVDPIIRIPTGRDLNMETRLAQISAPNLAEASGQPSAQMQTTPPAAATRGHTDLDISGTIVDAYLTVGFDVQNPGDLEAIRLIGWKGIPLAEVDMNFQATDAAQIAFNVGLVPDTSVVPTRIARFRDIIAALP